jgi:nondiscriminating aspartyl-tRNA synthetase
MEFEELQRARKNIGEVGAKDSGKSVTVAGWVYDVRNLGKVSFLLLRDMSGEIQITALKDKLKAETFKMLNKVSKESVIAITGKVKKSDKAVGGREIIPDKFGIISVAESPLPIDVSDFSKTELPKRLDYRFLDFHTKKARAIFRIQSTISQAFREYFAKDGFIEMQPPSIISSSSEGGTDLFSVKYFEKPAFLAQSPQLYKQMLACSMEKVFMTTTIWRAEKHNTIRHINEISQMDIETAFDDQMMTMKRLEGVVKYIVSEILKKNKDDLDLLKVKLKIPKAKYLSYDEAVKELKKKKVGISHGDDFSPEAEKKLDEIYPDTVVFVHSWPAELKPFYIMPKDKDSASEYSEGFDALYKGLEISSGGQRIHLPELLIKMLRKKELNPESFKDYVDSFRYGAPPHAGWSIGLERMTMILCGLENIREATMFPRDRDRLSP